MKIGLIISAILVLIIGGIVWLALHPSPDQPSSKTSPQQLALQTLPTDLPELVPAPPQGTGSALELYRKMVADYKDNARQLESRNPPARLVELMTNDLLAASHSAWSDQTAQGFLDDQMPITPGANPAFGAALEVIPSLVLKHALKQKNPSHTTQVAFAVWNTGLRAFNHSQRLYIRREGLNMMQLAGSAIFHAHEGDPGIVKSLAVWSKAINTITTNWDSKIQIIQAVRQHKGDLLNIAKNDQDIMFREAATAWLGVAKFNPGNRGNELGIAALIASSAKSDNTRIAAAGKIADSFTREELRKLH